MSKDSSLSKIKSAIISDKLKPGEPAYLIDRNFIESIDNCLKSGGKPGSIINKRIERAIKKGEELTTKDYIAVSAETWELLQSKFKGGPAIVRPVLPSLEVEIAPLQIQVSGLSEAKIISISRAAPYSELISKIQDKFSINDFNLFFSDSMVPVADRLTVDSSLNGHNSLTISDSSESHPVKTAEVRGLQNIGNSCFINAAIQCLFAVPEFPSLISGSADPLSSAFSSLLCTDPSKPAPTKPFKSVVDSLFPFFSGDDQNDASEFLGCVIDKLHDSIPSIDVLFYGLSTTHIKCALCQNEVLSKEPFSIISLSLSSTRRIAFSAFDLCSSVVWVSSLPNSNIILAKIAEYGLAFIPKSEFRGQNVFAFEVPQSDSGIALLTLEDSKGRMVALPTVLEVPSDIDISEEQLKEMVLRRISPLWSRGCHPNFTLFKPPTKFVSIKGQRFVREKVVAIIQNDVTQRNGFVGHRIRIEANQPTVSELLRVHLDETMLDTSDQWKCDKCLCSSSPSTRIELSKIPKYLFFVLERFNRRKGFEKDTSEVRIEEFITIYEKNYLLISVCNHIGNVNSGHYTTDALRGEKWYSFNDEYITPIHELDALSSQAYILLYAEQEKVEHSRGKA